MENKNQVSFWKPICSMLSFSSNITFKKVSTWILLVISSLLIFFITLLPIFFGKNADAYIYRSYAESITFYCLIVISITTGIQGVLRGLSIFKDSEKQGIEIILVSKPITRTQVLISRFTFLIGFSLFIGLINMILVIIAMAIVGFWAYSNIGLVIGGTFGCSILSFLIMALIAITIAILSPGKLSSILPFVILFLSSMVTIVMGSLGPILPKQLDTLKKQVIQKLNQNIKNDPNKYQDNNSGRTIKSFINRPFNNFFTLIIDKSLNTFIAIDPNVYLDCNYNDNQGYSQGSIRLDENVTLLSDIKSFVNSISSIPASGLVAINYLNPISALTSIGGGTSGISALSFQPNDISYNFNVLNIKEQQPITSNGTKYDNVWSFNVSQTDPSWAVALVWISILLILSGINIINYNRKDFK